MDNLNFKPRDYQKTISESCFKKNTLVVLPTGLGKTKIAIMTLSKRLRDYPNSKALFLTPTKPLANQIFNEIKESTFEKEISLFTGKIPPSKRKDLWGNSRVIISTPQCIENDLINNNLDLKEVSTLVIDEAHRAVQEYSYTWIAKQYRKTSNFERLIGLTASPGSDLKKILEVCKNLNSGEIEIRTEENEDVKKYIYKSEIKKIMIELPDNFKKIRENLLKSLDTKIEKLNKLGTVRVSKKPSKTEILRTQANLQGEIAKGIKDYNLFSSISLLAECLKIGHSIDLIETQGISSLFIYLNTIFKSPKIKTKAIKNLIVDPYFKAAYYLTENLEKLGEKHPKQKKLDEIIKEQIAKNPDIKIMIFNNYRNSVNELEKELNKIKNINSKFFVGQSMKSGRGLKQKEQIKILEDFKNSIYNCLISTSIGEEGLDLPRVDLVIFYEPIPSAIRSIQRRGRTSRHNSGKVIILVTKNTRDESNFWSAQNKEKRMYVALDKVKSELKKKNHPKLNEFINKKDSFMYVDSRECNSGITKKLHDLGIEIKLKPLPFADFIISEKIGVERKSTRDFVDSLIDKRIFTQLRNLRENFEKPLMIIEGIEDIYSIRNIHPNAIRGMLSTITISYGVPLLYTKNQKDTAELLKIISLREQKPNFKEAGVRLERKPLTTKDQQKFIIESFPGIGPSSSKRLLKKLKTIKNILDCPLETLKEIEGIGLKRAEEIKRILNEKYED